MHLDVRVADIFEDLDLLKQLRYLLPILYRSRAQIHVQTSEPLARGRRQHLYLGEGNPEVILGIQGLNQHGYLIHEALL